MALFNQINTENIDLQIQIGQEDVMGDDSPWSNQALSHVQYIVIANIMNCTWKQL